MKPLFNSEDYIITKVDGRYHLEYRYDIKKSRHYCNTSTNDEKLIDRMYSKGWRRMMVEQAI